ncbi:nucleotide-binding protein [uncultured Paraburkholderia sp.]|uniref:nucleotide-binding protein n=1 Tax=uncultured Paraburkholderia sp. TaxID=1822466 RepID=UPI002591EA9C|nr:nucleotide-binding protein [uncultured Paraburkholderia sp.]
MATRKSTAPAPLAPKLQLSPTQIERGIARLEERIDELRKFDVAIVPDGASPELTALSAAIQDTLVRCFGEGTFVYKRFESATRLNFRPGYFGGGYPARHDYQEGAKENISAAILLLQEAQRALREDLADAEHDALPVPVTTEQPQVLSRRVFLVHGHDEGAREIVARFLEKIGFEPVILHEKASQNRTVIEKIEAYHDVGFAVVLLTPDDEGCVKGGQPEPRARQNVLLELGYFMGRIGRDKVCALKRGAVEIPSDFAGVVWVSMEDNGWKQELSKELEAAGHDIDWNRVMRP